MKSFGVFLLLRLLLLASRGHLTPGTAGALAIGLAIAALFSRWRNAHRDDESDISGLGSIGRLLFVLVAMAAFIVLIVVLNDPHSRPVPQPPDDAAVATSPVVSNAPPTTCLRAYYGTFGEHLAKHWVMVDGDRLDGISLVLPAPGARVSIVYAEGGRNVPASILPQGFLDDWNITPQKLKTADSP